VLRNSLTSQRVWHKVVVHAATTEVLPSPGIGIEPEILRSPCQFASEVGTALGEVAPSVVVDWNDCRGSESLAHPTLSIRSSSSGSDRYSELQCRLRG
jgi:hypothetical protein